MESTEKKTEERPLFTSYVGDQWVGKVVQPSISGHAVPMLVTKVVQTTDYLFVIWGKPVEAQ